MRADLICKPIWFGGQSMWVIKDPLSRNYSYVSGQEYRLLQLANGHRTLEQLVVECQRQIAPQPISVDAVEDFFASAYADSIVLINGVGCDAAQDPQQRRRWWHNPLAIRCPGINVDPCLDQWLPIIRVFTQRSMVVATGLLMFVGWMIVVTQFTELAMDLRVLSSRLMRGEGLFAFALVIAISKIVHELGHAISCKRFGADVVEMGVMFLFGTPCLYCDVSDAWMLPESWKRIFVSAAGMIAELVLASIAAIVWSFASQGPVRDLSAIVMVVCSVSTVFFNGNPLLRYDGYFILSDLTGVPNLASQATHQVRSWLRRIIWGPQPFPGRTPAGQTIWIGLYGIASAAYRIALYTLIAWTIYRIAADHSLGSMVGILMIAFLARLGWTWARPLWVPPEEDWNGSWRRPLIVTCAAMAVVIGLGLIPLPQTVQGPIALETAGGQPVFVTRGGRITAAIAAGSQVRQGDVIARLENAQTSRELLAMAAQCERLRIQLDGLRSSRRPESSAPIASLERSYAEALKRHRLLQQSAETLLLRAPRNGQVFPARQLPSIATTARQAQSWTGTPLDPRNRGAYLTPGTVLCVVGESTARQATVLLRQQDIEWLRRDQRLTLRLADHRRGQVTGRVTEIASSPAIEIEPELALAAHIDPLAAHTPPHYLVRVTLDDTPHALPIRTIGHAKIHVDPTSIIARLVRFCADVFA
jgi:putative peptide zinc metalloprotease protein